MITVVGIGADGWDGLGAAARAAIGSARTLMGSERQLAMVPTGATEPGSARELLPSPLLPALEGLTGRDGLVLLASGDPMLHGIGATLARRLPTHQLKVVPAVSSVSLAAARLGWPLAEVTVVSCVTAPPETVLAHLGSGRRVLVLARDGSTAATMRDLLDANGWADSPLLALSKLGAVDEAVYRYSSGPTDDLTVLAILGVPDAAAAARVGVGVPDGAFDTDGALTRREVRLLALSSLRPAPAELLWDVGAGSGSIAIEWLRAEPLASAVAIEPRRDRAERITRNAVTLGVPRLRVDVGSAPDALRGLDTPGAVFVGGGVTTPGVLELCWDSLPPGGRLVATAVTIESEALLHSWHARVGGELTRLAVSKAEPLGSFTTWRPELPVVVFAAVKS